MGNEKIQISHVTWQGKLNVGAIQHSSVLVTLMNKYHWYHFKQWIEQLSHVKPVNKMPKMYSCKSRYFLKSCNTLETTMDRLQYLLS